MSVFFFLKKTEKKDQLKVIISFINGDSLLNLWLSFCKICYISSIIWCDVKMALVKITIRSQEYEWSTLPKKHLRNSSLFNIKMPLHLISEIVFSEISADPTDKTRSLCRLKSLNYFSLFVLFRGFAKIQSYSVRHGDASATEKLVTVKRCVPTLSRAVVA